MKIIKSSKDITTLGELKPGDLFIMNNDAGTYILTNERGIDNCYAVDLEIGYGCYLALDIKVTKLEGTLYVEEAKKNDTNK